MNAYDMIRAQCEGLADAITENREKKRCLMALLLSNIKQEDQDITNVQLPLPDLRLAKEAWRWIQEWRHRGELVRPILEAWDDDIEYLEQFCIDGIDFRTGHLSPDLGTIKNLIKAERQGRA
ncbi:MAG: hypothetical protein AAFV29_27230 [Myxococcota bacterium]